MTRTARLLAAGALALTAAAAGCASGVEGETAGDCSLQIRHDGDTYTSYGFTDREGTRYTPADEASCEDVGEHPRGSVFSEDAPRVTTWTFSGYSPDDVLGVRFDADSFTVYVADSVAPDERDRIFEELAPHQTERRSRLRHPRATALVPDGTGGRASVRSARSTSGSRRHHDTRSSGP